MPAEGETYGLVAAAALAFSFQRVTAESVMEMKGGGSGGGQEGGLRVILVFNGACRSSRGGRD